MSVSYYTLWCVFNQWLGFKHSHKEYVELNDVKESLLKKISQEMLYDKQQQPHSKIPILY